MPSARAARSLSARSLAHVLFAGVLSIPRLAYGYGERAPVDLELLRPAPGNARILTTDLARVGERSVWVFQSFLHYADRPLVLLCRGQCPPRESVALIGDRVTLETSVAVSLAQRVQLAVSLPVTLYQYSDSAILDGAGPMAGAAAPAASAGMAGAGTLTPGAMDGQGAASTALLRAPVAKPAGLGDVRLHAKVALLPHRWRFGLGIDGALALPSGDGDSYLGTRLPSFTTRLLAHVEYRRLTVALNFGGRFANQEQVLGLPSGHALTYGLGGQVRLFGDQEGTPFYLLAEIYGLAYVRFASATDFPAEFLIAAKSEPGRWALFVGAGSTLFPGVGTPNVRGLIGLSYSTRRAQRRP